MRCRSRGARPTARSRDRKSTRLNSSHSSTSYAVFCSKNKSSMPTRPGAAPSVIISEAEGSGEVGYAGEEARAQVLTGLLSQAFACDLARVATLQYTCVQCFMSVERLVGVKMDLHELAHLSTIEGVFFLMIRQPPKSTLFPYTPLFR